MKDVTNRNILLSRLKVHTFHPFFRIDSIPQVCVCVCVVSQHWLTLIVLIEVPNSIDYFTCKIATNEKNLLIFINNFKCHFVVLTCRYGIFGQFFRIPHSIDLRVLFKCGFSYTFVFSFWNHSIIVFFFFWNKKNSKCWFQFTFHDRRNPTLPLPPLSKLPSKHFKHFHFLI